MDNVIEEAVEFVEKADTALLITINEENKPDSRLIGPFVNKLLTIYIFTLMSSNKIKQIVNNQNISLYFQNKFENTKEYKSISLYGIAHILEKEEDKNKIMKKLEIKSKGYSEWIKKDGWEKWAIIKMQTNYLKYVNNSKSHMPLFKQINN